MYSSIEQTQAEQESQQSKERDEGMNVRMTSNGDRQFSSSNFGIEARLNTKVLSVGRPRAMQI